MRWSSEGALIHCFGMRNDFLHLAGCVYVQVTIIHLNWCRLDICAQALHASLYRCLACWALGKAFFSANIIKKQPISEVKRPEGVVCLVMCENP
mmetsp:Transcript_36250/g.78152  ORF Transcript_36250/g.78152 Transcript_36250/m.78152 type:complete len:94 (-) Transcript_36250:41-322(-)